MTQTDIILEVKDLCVEFRTAEGTVQAVDHLSYVLHKGEKLGIVGERRKRQERFLSGNDAADSQLRVRLQEGKFYTLEGIW